MHLDLCLADRKPIHFRFYQDLVKVACLFFAIGFGGMIYSVYTWIRNGAYLHEIILNSLDIVTFVVPPLLPAGLTACTFFAQKRLKNEKIFCLSSKHISLSGGVDVVCFDKVTGSAFAELPPMLMIIDWTAGWTT